MRQLNYLQNLFTARGTGYTLRNSEIKLNIRKPRTNYLIQSLCYSGHYYQIESQRIYEGLVR